MTGEHAARAGETALAIDCFEQATAEAARRFANTAALEAYRRAQELLDGSQPARCVDILAQMNPIADIIGDRALQDFLLAERVALLDRQQVTTANPAPGL